MFKFSAEQKLFLSLTLGKWQRNLKNQESHTKLWCRCVCLKGGSYLFTKFQNLNEQQQQKDFCQLQIMCGCLMKGNVDEAWW